MTLCLWKWERSVQNLGTNAAANVQWCRGSVCGTVSEDTNDFL